MLLKFCLHCQWTAGRIRCAPRSREQATARGDKKLGLMSCSGQSALLEWEGNEEKKIEYVSGKKRLLIYLRQQRNKTRETGRRLALTNIYCTDKGVIIGGTKIREDQTAAATCRGRGNNRHKM